MRYSISILACVVLLLGSAGIQAADPTPKGKDDKLEWQVQANWKIAGKPVDIAHSLDGKYVFILDSEHRVLVYDNKGQLQGRIPVAAGVTSIDIAPQGEMLYLVDDTSNSFSAMKIGFVTSIDVTGSPFKGKEDAPVTIAVFTDFE